MSDMVNSISSHGFIKVSDKEKPFNWYFWEGFYKDSNVNYNSINTELYNT